MTANLLYLKDVAVNGFGSLSETAPSSTTTGTGWVVAKTSSANFSKLLYGTERSGAFSTTDALTTAAVPASGDSWRSENPISGTYANTNWVLTFAVRAVSAASSQAGRVKVRIWRGTNAAGTGATQITSAVLVGTTSAALSTSADVTSVVTFTPGATITLTNEYLFVQCEWEITTASGSNNGDVDFRAGTASNMALPAFTAASVGSSSGAGAVSGKGTGLAVRNVSSAGTGTASGKGTVINVSTAAAAGTSTAVGVGTSIVIAGVQAAITWLELEIAQASLGAGAGVGTASGTSTAAGVGATGVTIISGAGAAAGTSTATAKGTGINVSTGSAIGSGAGTGKTAYTFAFTGTAAGTGTATASGVSVGQNIGNAAGIGSANAVGAVALLIVSGVGTAAGTSGANASSSVVMGGVGTAAGVGAASSLSFYFSGSAFSLVPDADNTDGGWTNETGGTVLYSSIDEAAPNDSDYIISSDRPVSDICKISLSDPGGGIQAPLAVFYRYKKSGPNSIDLRVRLLEGSTQIASWTHTNIDANFINIEQVLSSGELASIGDPTNLFLEFKASV